MGRGFLAGLFWGGIVSVVVLFVASQSLDRQQLSFPRPEASAVEVPGGSEFDQARPETQPVLPDADSRPAEDNVAGVAVPRDIDDMPPALDDTALEVPVPATTVEAPETLGAAPSESAAGERPATVRDTGPESAATSPLSQPERPGVAPEARVAEPEEPAPAAPQEDAGAVDVAGEAPAATGGTEIAPLPVTEAEAGQPDTGAAPAVIGRMDAPESPTLPDIGAQGALPGAGGGRVVLGDAPAAPGLPQIESEPSLPPAGSGAVPDVPEPEVPETTPEPGTDAPQPAEDTTDATDTPTVLRPLEQTEEAPGAGLPQIGDDGSLPVVRRFGDTEPETETVVEDAPEADAEEVRPDLPALAAFATPFQNPRNLPLLSLVLVHQTPGALPPRLLGELPATVGIALDASRSDAAELAAGVRAAGREVVMIPALPENATPQDIEQALRANFDRLPQAVALMDVTGSSFQSDREAVAQVVDVVEDSGHGIITFPRGLNTAHQQAERAGVPTGLIFRNLDADGETEEQVRRGLDRAAFRARQNDAVILVASTAPGTLAAVAGWVADNQDGSVILAPVSAALLEN